MKVIIGAALLLLSLPALSAPCLPLGDYQIKDPITFKDEPLLRAMSILLVGTPISVIDERNPSGQETGVSGFDISGPLDQIIKNATDSVGISYVYSAADCRLVLKPGRSMLDAQEVINEDGWEFKKGENLKDVLTNWSEQAGWRVSYEIDGRIVLGDSLRFSGSYESAVIELLNVIKNSSKVVVNYRFHRGNKMLRIYRSALAEISQSQVQAQTKGSQQ